MDTNERERPMTASGKPNRLLQVAYVLAASIGLKFGFDAGNEISGILLGVVMAMNTGAIGVIFVATLADRLGRRKPAREPNRPEETG